MQTAIFGITNDGLNLAVNLILLILVIVWIALIVYTFLDARRRIEDPVLVACATIASFAPYIGTAVYAILRPPEFLEDARERDLEMKASELRVRQLSELACPNCNYIVEKNYLRCPNCQRRLKDPCHTCGKPVDPRWALCPYCESVLPGQGARPRQGPPQAPGRQERRPRSPRPEGRSAPPPRSPGSSDSEAPTAQSRGARRASERDARRAAEREPSRAPSRASAAREPAPDDTVEHPGPDQS